MTTSLQELQEERVELERQRELQSEYIRTCCRGYGYESCDQCEQCIPKYCGLRQDWRATNRQLTTTLRQLQKT